MDASARKKNRAWSDTECASANAPLDGGSERDSVITAQASTLKCGDHVVCKTRTTVWITDDKSEDQAILARARVEKVNQRKREVTVRWFASREVLLLERLLGSKQTKSTLVSLSFGADDFAEYVGLNEVFPLDAVVKKCEDSQLQANFTLTRVGEQYQLMRRE